MDTSHSLTQAFFIFASKNHDTALRGSDMRAGMTGGEKIAV
jgi:hypothetical protein